jgi:hypothetical protein
MRKRMISEQIFSKKLISEIEPALTAYQFYQRAGKIIDRVKVASGRKGKYSLKNSSTTDITLNTHGIRSTQKI